MRRDWLSMKCYNNTCSRETWHGLDLSAGRHGDGSDGAELFRAEEGVLFSFPDLSLRLDAAVIVSTGQTTCIFRTLTEKGSFSVPYTSMKKTIEISLLGWGSCRSETRPCLLF